MKLALCIYSMILLSFPLSCSKAAFHGDNKDDPSKKTLPSRDSEKNPTLHPVQSPPLESDASKAIELIVTTPVTSVKAGGEMVQATAKIKNSEEVPSVSWAVSGPAGESEIGTIDANGIYTTPAAIDKEIRVTITASLKSDPKVSSSAVLDVVPVDQLFARCKAGSLTFPILAHVYSVPETSTQLPDYSNPAEATEITTVCMENYAVEPRDFSQGFPDVQKLNEYFSLQTTTNLVIPETGTYTFELNSDDGARLSIDGKEVINNDGLHRAYGPSPEESPSTGKKEVTLTLTQGSHPLSLNYFQGPKLRIALVLKWKTPDTTTLVYVPREAFH